MALVLVAARAAYGDVEAWQTQGPASNGAFDDPSSSLSPGPILYGREGSRRLTLLLGHGFDLTDADNTEVVLKLGLSSFIADDLSLDLELDFLSVNQEGTDAFAIGGTFLFRWHFLSDVNWSLYFEGGVGLIYATEPVPDLGTRLNLTPQAGLGVSFDVTPEIRGMIGMRWHHISNANTSSSNPGRDNLLLYGGVSLPF